MPEALCYTTATAQVAIGCSRAKLYDLIGEKKLDARKMGSRTVITAKSLQAYIEALPEANIRPSKRQREKAAADAA